MSGEANIFSRLTARQRTLAGMVLALSNFMVVLDLTIANVSVPHISGNLGITPDQGTWIITSYAVAEAICVPLTGWLAQRFGVVKMFISAMVGFGLFSVLCGLSMSLSMIVVCRIGQGLCGGPIMPMSQTLMLRVFPPERRARAMGLWAMTTLLGPAMGPIIGGYISDNWSWHWIFFINLPIAILCVFAAMALLRPVETETARVPIDKIGLALLVFWIGCLQVMLDLGRDHDWFADPLILSLAILSLIGFLVFIIWELTEEHPIVDLRVFRHVGFTTGVLSLALCYGAYFSGIVIIPQWLQSARGYTATWAGIVTAFTAMAALMSAPVAARIMGRGVDPRFMISGAVLWLGLMTLWRAHWTSSVDFWMMAAPQFIQGFAMPFFMIPLTTLTLGSVRPEETASAAGLQNFLRTMALAIATSLVLTGWGNGQRVSRSELAGTLQPADTQAALANIGMSTDQARQVISNIVDQEATAISVDHIFFISALILFFASAMVWLAPRPRPNVDTSAAH
ncbi:MAG: DHA2 family efflux MFS transporter permease subunit [Pseudomonadota bacterium]|uniref:MFS transporter n=1 Tax=Sphingobium xenophagum TaxID=121428 RepID=A0A249MSR9_SPHXE|nr:MULTISPECIES: DHA2 family efflux MFS transporter permease subunit [Sphingobium]ASY44342.1 MFS transporter [Sphingobium xenophagum]OUC56426.1 MFS transporter [Sphingobium sp. GW456-12-10-14-TSB1]QWT15354.1 DHA2 family efflux MFS transporter permease subunit [Sphingobium xenophagum]